MNNFLYFTELYGHLHVRVSNCNLTNKIIIGYNRVLTIKYLKRNTVTYIS